MDLVHVTGSFTKLLLSLRAQKFSAFNGEVAREMIATIPSYLSSLHYEEYMRSRPTLSCVVLGESTIAVDSYKFQRCKTI